MDMTQKPSGDSKGEDSADAQAGGTASRAEFQYCKHCGGRIPLNSTACPYCGRGQLTTELQVEATSRKRFESYVLKKMRVIRLTAFLICMGIFILQVVEGSQMPLSEEEAQLIIGEAEGVITPDLSVLEIAVNNIVISLTFYLPVFGVLLMAFVSYSTGVFISAIAALSASRTLSEILLSTFLFPWSWLEISAYSLAASEGILLLLGLLTRRFREEVKTLPRTILISVALLVVAAVVEGAVIMAG